MVRTEQRERGGACDFGMLLRDKKNAFTPSLQKPHTLDSGHQTHYSKATCDVVLHTNLGCKIEQSTDVYENANCTFYTNQVNENEQSR